ncbi:type IV secretory system conjugative DNA transfer family protein [Nitrosomonas sp. Is37]|uniref:type IV secretory system conjugative DNA transfer family protein n=1 Tax=Nitrosomonas sp. Is37 TaxID=3080535 RepID=UPI00294ACCA8|nr:type IV secretory system conjugative DNA transfer family protein [Nitrosomonas sp. Is37]MDV6344558.1 type IV secretory system conjugative DNA transfer family protein [Nitrosomonas sp. Is37]
MVADSDWRTMVAMASFQQEYESHPKFLDWLHTEQPLLSLPSLQQILDIENLDSTQRPNPGVSMEGEKNKNTIPLTVIPTNPSHLRIGVTQDYQSRPYEINHADLVRHAAFLGGSGSGKTTLALNIIEQLLLEGVPAILLDRKGDLYSYALEAAWQTPISDPVRAQMHDKLRAKIEIAVYTSWCCRRSGTNLEYSYRTFWAGATSKRRTQATSQSCRLCIGQNHGPQRFWAR